MTREPHLDERRLRRRSRRRWLQVRVQEVPEVLVVQDHAEVAAGGLRQLTVDADLG